MAVSPVGAHRVIDLTIEELQAKFRRAAPKWPCPDERILAGCPHLTSPARVSRMVVKPVPAQGEVRKALRALQAELPTLVETYQALSLMRPLSARLAVLRSLQGMLPDALAAVQINQRSSATQWRDAASRIAYEATIAWQHAGRMEVGINVNSPLVSLVQDILACAGVERARKTIANALGSDRPSNKTQNKDSIRGSAAAAE